MRATILCILCCAGWVSAVPAQQKQADQPAGTATVSGRVFCADTNTPARMASVVLQPAEVVEAIGSGHAKDVSYGGEASETDLDGSFTIQHVPPGVYYVIASQTGYISPLAPLRVPAMEQPGDAKAGKKALSSAPRITLQANLPVAVNVSIERGAAVSGTVLYDDGSPANGLWLEVLVHSPDKGKWVPIPSAVMERSSHSGSTDDEGRYRIAGLPPGEYVLEAELSLTKTIYKVDAHGGASVSTNRVDVTDVYSGGSTREEHAVPFTLSAGEQRRGEDIEVPLSKLHTVRGVLVASHDGHLLNGGKLSLLNADNKGKASSTSLTRDDEGFTFSYVPEGDYIVRVDEASDSEYLEVRNPDGWPPTRTETHVLRTYGSTDLPLHVAGEVSGLTISVPDQPSQKAQSKP